MGGLLAHQLLAGPEQFAHRPYAYIGHEARADQAVREQVGGQTASATSVLRPGTFFTCAALARIRVRPSAASTCQTGRH